jgi:hypothetical protein
MKIVVDQSVPGEAIQGRQIHLTTEGLRAGVPEVVEEDHDDIGRASRCLDLEDRRSVRLMCIELGDRGVRRLSDGQHGPVEGVRRARPRARRRLLRLVASGQQQRRQCWKEVSMCRRPHALLLSVIGAKRWKGRDLQNQRSCQDTETVLKFELTRTIAPRL